LTSLEADRAAEPLIGVAEAYSSRIFAFPGSLSRVKIFEYNQAAALLLAGDIDAVEMRFVVRNCAGWDADGGRTPR
jgi:hypothetical protein